jgi:DNA repair protein RecO (recombination protein O)
MLTKNRAIVLHSIKYGDSSLIIDLYTESYGRQSFIVRMPVSKRGKLKKQLFQPMSILEVDFDYRQNVAVQRMRDVRLVFPYLSIPYDVLKQAISLFISEFLYYSLRGEQQNYPLFEYVVNSMRWLDACSGRFPNFHLVFMMRMSKFLGFLPNIENYHSNDFFDLRGGCFCHAAPLHSDFLKPDEAARIQILMRMNYETMHLYAMSRSERNRCIEVMIHYYRLHLPDFPDMKSFDVLREVFG